MNLFGFIKSGENIIDNMTEAASITPENHWEQLSRVLLVVIDTRWSL